MRVNVLILTCILSLTESAVAQVELPSALVGPHVGNIDVPIGSERGLDQLEKAALLGERRASALLAVLLQEASHIEGSLIRSAIHFQVAIAAGCSDLRAPAAMAVARLSPDERQTYDLALPFWLPAIADQPDARSKGPCLSW